MARVKISEWKAKKLLYEHIGLPFTSFRISNLEAIPRFDTSLRYVVKVDQGIKKRFKSGLLEVNVSSSRVGQTLKTLAAKGYSQFIVEPHLLYPSNSERYFSLERVREGLRLIYSLHGGVDIEAHPDQVVTKILSTESDIKKAGRALSFSGTLVAQIVDAFETYHLAFLEINPYVVIENTPHFLDAAIEVDSCAEFFVNGAWTAADFVDGIGFVTPEEEAVKQLASQSTAAFMLKVINPNASLFFLLNSGGSSIVIADQVFDKGWGAEIGNFGENSGSPTTEESYIYSKNILKLLIDSPKEKKALVIGGGVANFTDVRTTFKGIVRALEEVAYQLRSQGVKVFVRRGGPNQTEGLQLMRDYLEENLLLGAVYGPDVVLTQAIDEAIQYLEAT